MLNAAMSRLPSRLRRLERRVTWIFGSPRSGSTWLYLMLSELDDVVSMNEPLLGHYLAPFLCDQPGVDISSLDVSTFTIRRVDSGRPDQFFADQFADVWQPELRRLINARVLAHVASAMSTRPTRAAIVIKEPNGSQSADLIMRAQPDAHLLFLLRDGRDVVDSAVAANTAGSWATTVFPGVVGVEGAARSSYVQNAAYKWLWQTEVVEQAFAEHRGPKKLVRYEHMLEDPVGHLGEIASWMGINASREQVQDVANRLDFAKIPATERGQDKFFRSAQPGSWRRNLDPACQELMMNVLGEKLRALGYTS